MMFPSAGEALDSSPKASPVVHGEPREDAVLTLDQGIERLLLLNLEKKIQNQWFGDPIWTSDVAV